VALAAQPGQEDVEAPVELGGAVVVGQLGGETPQLRELLGRESVQAAPEDVVTLLGVGDHLLKFRVLITSSAMTLSTTASSNASRLPA
jgi:hypothetical protein